MLHTYVHGGDCIAIGYDDTTLVINPSSDNYQQSQRIAQHPGIHILATDDMVGDTDIGPFSVQVLDGGLLVRVADREIVYHHRNPAFSFSRVPDLLLVDMSVGWDVACQVAARITGKTIVPVGVTSQDDPIGFCREVLLHHRGVPKYLKPGQYVVH